MSINAAVKKIEKDTIMKRKKHLGQSGSLHSNPDKNERFVLRKCAGYLDRLLGAYTLTDSETINMLAWVLGPEIIDVGIIFLKRMEHKAKEKYLSDLEENLHDPDEVPDSICRILRYSNKKVVMELMDVCRTALDRRYKALAYSGRSDTEKKLDVLAKMFHLSDEEIVLVEFIYIISVWQQVEDYFVDHLQCQNISRRAYIKAILEMTEKELDRALSGTLARVKFFEMDKHTFTLADDFLAYFQKPSSELLKNEYFARFSRKTIPLGNHLIEPKVTEQLLSLLKVKRGSANHILLYGPPGTGKTSYALGLAQKLKVPTYEIIQEEWNHARNRRAAILACLNMTNGGDGSLIVVDEADNLLNTQNSWFTRGETQDKGWLNQLLEEKCIRMIWITNNIDEIEGSVLRRFAFSVHFRAFNRRQRISLWESVLKRRRARSCFNAEEINSLAMRYPVSAAVIDLAVGKALETSKPKDAAFHEIVKLNLDAHLTLINSGEKPKTADKIEDNYSVDGLHIEGNLPAIMEQLEAFDRRLRDTDQCNVRNFNLLFYGPPGAGKSELARYIAKHLDRELMVKRISDIVSPYVGETEQNISRVFAAAEAAEALLVMDEADSFLFNRERAVRSWEISHTNEFLTQMERFRGILICTTNRFADVDSASVRRFNQKIGFRCLKKEGNIIFYKKLLSELAAKPLNKEGEEMLGKISDLTPGDFRVVRDRFAIFPQARVNHEMMIQGLREEAQIKKNQAGRKSIGFIKSSS